MCSLLVANFFYVCQMHGRYTILCPVEILIVHANEIFVKFTLQQATKAHKRSRVIALFFL